VIHLTIVERNRGKELSEEQFDACFGAGSFLVAKNYHRVFRQLHSLQSEQVAVEAAILDAALAGSETGWGDRVERLRTIRAEISSHQEYIKARDAEDDARFAERSKEQLSSWRANLYASSLVS
jgi:hypothetical protein